MTMPTKCVVVALLARVGATKARGVLELGQWLALSALGRSLRMVQSAIG